ATTCSVWATTIRSSTGTPAPTPGSSSTTAATSLARGSTRSRSITGAPPRSSTLPVRCSRTTSVASTGRSDPRRMRRAHLLRAALAYLRIAVTPTAVRGADLVEVQRRPSRALPPWIDKWLSRCRDVAAVAAAADRIDDRGVAEKLRLLHADLERLANIADEGTTRDVLTAVRDDIGLGRAMTLLDGGRGGDGSSHLDDLEGLLQVADLHDDPAGFDP